MEPIQNSQPGAPTAPPIQDTSNPAPLQPTSPIKKARKFSLKAVISIIIFLLLAGGAAAGFAYREPILKLFEKPTPTPSPAVTISPSPIPDSTSDWKTFSYNSYSLKVPPEWHAGSGNTDEFAQLINYDESKAAGRGFDPNQDKGMLKIEIAEFKSLLSLEEFLKESQKEPSSTGLSYIPKSPKEITVDNQPAIIDGTNVFAKNPKNDTVFLIGFGLDFAREENLQNQILTTFKFTQTPPDNSPSSPFIYKIPLGWNENSENINKIEISKTENLNIEGQLQPATSTITIYSQQLNPVPSLSDWLRTRYLRNDENLFSIAKDSIKNKMVDGVNALYIEMPGAGGYNDSGTVFIKDNIGYDISLKGINLSSSKQAYEQILSTFKFTD